MAGFSLFKYFQGLSTLIFQDLMWT